MSKHPPEAYAHLKSVRDGTCKVWMEVYHDYAREEVRADDPAVLPVVDYCWQHGLTDWHREFYAEGEVHWWEAPVYIITSDGLEALWEYESNSESADDKSPQHVTLSQVASYVCRSKRTLEDYKRKGMPAPAIRGGGRGKPDEWVWDELRPWLEKTFDRKLPEQFPTLNPPPQT